ncbi:MAG: hypothetical protein LUE64_05170 [Candidatus Gastranaerophilales bacterium]|nr:hypothetical protein [Candidatus Gastranaerophilales bacterium]
MADNENKSELMKAALIALFAGIFFCLYTEIKDQLNPITIITPEKQNAAIQNINPPSVINKEIKTVTNKNENFVIYNLSSGKYHKESCTWAKKCQNCIKIPVKEAKEKGGKPCRVCGGI